MILGAVLKLRFLKKETPACLGVGAKLVCEEMCSVVVKVDVAQEGG